MPKGILQEKFQRTVQDPHTDGENSWASFTANRVTYPTTDKTITSDRPGADAQTTIVAPFTNHMPPGMFIDNQQSRITSDHKQFKKPDFPGNSDPSWDVNARVIAKGFHRLPMRPDDDMYTNEHVEGFYGDAKGEDDAGNKYNGFLERNNYLDRE